MSESKVNYVKRPLPSGPGPQQITVADGQCKKGGSPMNSELPKKNIVKGPGDKK